MRIISKQSVAGFVVGALLCSSIGVGAASVFFYNYDIKVNIDGKQLNATIVHADGKNYAGIREIAEALGATVKWDAATNSADISTTKPGTVQDVAKQADNCVKLSCMNGTKQVATASGVLWGTDYILTNKHVLTGANKWIAEKNSSELDMLYCTEAKTFDVYGLDIALLKTDVTNEGSTKVGNSDNVKVGDNIVIISSPDGIKNVVSTGIVSNRDVSEGVEYIYTEATIKPGSSGGGMFNMNGELVGLIKGSVGNEKAVFMAIAINDIKKAIDNTK